MLAEESFTNMVYAEKLEGLLQAPLILCEGYIFKNWHIFELICSIFFAIEMYLVVQVREKLYNLRFLFIIP